MARDLDDKKFKAKLLSAINDVIDPNMEESDCRRWMSILPEAKRYINNKIKVCRKRINNLELELELIEADISQSVRKTNTGAATERKAIIESAFRKDPLYKEYYSKIYDYQELIEGYQADLDNLTEKSFAVRKIADFEKVHLMYEDD